MSDTSVHGAVDRATDSTAFEYAARAGFAVSGVLHFLVAFIVLRIAFGTGGGNADQSGALTTLSQQPGGSLMLWVAAVGMAALGAVARRRGHRRQASRRAVAVTAGFRGPACVEARERHRCRHPVFRDRLLRSTFRDGQRPVQRSAERRADRPAHAIGLGQGPSDRRRAGRRRGRRLPRLQGLLARSSARTCAARAAAPVETVGVTGYVAKGLVFAGAGLLVIIASLHRRPVEGSRPRRRGQDARSGALRQVPADPRRARNRRLRRLQLRAKPARPDVASLSAYWNDSTSAASCPGETATPHWARRSVSGWAILFRSRNSPG